MASYKNEKKNRGGPGSLQYFKGIYFDGIKVSVLILQIALRNRQPIICLACFQGYQKVFHYVLFSQ